MSGKKRGRSETESSTLELPAYKSVSKMYAGGGLSLS